MPLRPDLIAVSLLAAAAGTAAAQTLADDFSDGNDAGWLRVFYGTNYADRWSVVNGEYRLNTLNPAPADGSSFLLATWADSTAHPAAYHDGVLTLKVRIMAEGVSAGVYLRSDLDWFAYCFVISSALDTVRLEAYPAGEPFQLLGEWPVPGGVQVGAAYRLRAEAVGPWISVKLWRDGDEEPVDPQVRVRDNRLPSGLVGLYTYMSNRAAGPGRIDTRFDDVVFTPVTPCGPDFNGDGFMDFFDYDDFTSAFEVGDPWSDFNGDGFLDFFDYDDFVAAFEAGC